MPDTLGQILRAAREKKGVTASQAAAATRIKIQQIEAIERDDFSRMSAPIYAMGFIKLYAAYLGVEPAPLVKEYQDRFAPKEKPEIDVGEVMAKKPKLSGKTIEPEPLEEPVERSTAERPTAEKKSFAWPKIDLSPMFWKKLGYVIGVVLVAVLMVVLASRCTAYLKERRLRPKPPPPPAARPGPLPVVQEPPEPFMEPEAPSQ